VTQQMEL